MTELGKQPPVKELAHGRWPEILPLLGVDGSLLDGKHQACPFCGGKDRFRFTDHEGEGMYICNQCGPGSGFDLIMGINGCDFPAAALSVRRVLNGAGPPAVSTKLDGRDKARRNAEKIWRQSKELDTGDNQVVDYLKGRGLSRCSTTLRIHAGIFDGQTGKTWPSMVAPIHGPDQELLGLHITHLELDPSRGVWDKAKIDNPKKQRVIAGTVSGGSVQLFRMGPSLELGIAEGIETAIAVRELFAVACWSVMSTAGMEKFKLPDIKPMTLRIFADNDKNHAGMKAAYNLANRLAIKDDYFNTFVERPPTMGDWLDFLNSHATHPKVRDIQ